MVSHPNYFSFPPLAQQTPSYFRKTSAPQHSNILKSSIPSALEGGKNYGPPKKRTIVQFQTIENI